PTKIQNKTGMPTLPKLLELIDKFSKVAGYKVNLQKSIVFLYTNNEILEKEHQNTLPFKIAPPKIKYLGINLTKEVKDLYAENYKALIRRSKKIQRNGKIFHAHGPEK
uniref:Reverse transcriptase n=1 Tax=Catagonus wagneri TaxID=51154 RepID=A0A8C3WCU8_9CETA